MALGPQGPIPKASQRRPRFGATEASLMPLSLIYSTSDEFLKALITVAMQSLDLSCHEHERWRRRGVGCRHVSTMLRGLHSVGCQIRGTR